MRQTIFDMLMHASWGGRALLDGAVILDSFAGTGALGLEALSRGAGHATFMEQDRAALAAIAENIAQCRATNRCRIIAADVTKPPRGEGQALVFLDPPYAKDLLSASVGSLRKAGWIIPGTIIISESGRLESDVQYGIKLAHRMHGAAQVNVWREL